MNLIELHSAVKQHPARSGGVQSEVVTANYRDLLYKLSHEFWEVIHNHPKYSFSKEMLHDFNYAIRHDDSQSQLHVELCLGVIHTFIDTGTVPYFYDWYTGVNRLKGRPARRKLVYVEKYQKYIPVYTKKQVQDCIAEIEEYQATHSTSQEYFKYSIYSHTQLEFFKNYLERDEWYT